MVVVGRVRGRMSESHAGGGCGGAWRRFVAVLVVEVVRSVVLACGEAEEEEKGWVP